MRLILVNIGNTRTTLATAAGARIERRRRLPTAGLTAAALDRALTALTGARPAAGAVMACVVPRAGTAVRRALARRGVPVHAVGPRSPLGVALSYPRPATLGADRLANAAAAAGDAPVIAVDAGTATTFDVVLPRRGFVGGVIAPGPALMLDYLADRTAKLPRVRPGRVREGIGASTVAAMRIGADVGYRALLLGILEHLRRQPGLSHARVVFTGGAARSLPGGAAAGARVDPELTLRGLALIGARVFCA